MKNKILIILIVLLLLIGGVLVVNFLINKEDKPKTPSNPDDLGNNINTVEIKSNKGVKEVKIDDITISNIGISVLEEKTELFLEFTSTETDLGEITLTVVLLNNTVADSANQKKIIFNKETTIDKNHKIVVLDITNIYNDPNNIKFIIDKNTDK